MRMTGWMLLVLLLPLASGTAGNPEASPFEFLPGRLLFRPRVADTQEPRTGLRKEIGSSRMKLDIGSTLDVLEFSPPGTYTLRLGIEFFTYALTTSNQGLRLQIAAVNGLFGGHITMTPRMDSTGLSLRLRLLHVSAHLIDGSFDNDAGAWQDGRLPIPYTRDFGELIASYDWMGASLYGGFSYATLVRPSDVRKTSFLAGIELHSARVIGPVAGKETSLYFAYHFLLSGVPSFVGGNSAEGGMKFGAWSGSGIKLYLSYYSGLDVFSQYYNIRRTFWGLGFAFDFW